MKLNKYKRYQKGLKMSSIYPVKYINKKKVCACGCKRSLPKKARKWHSTQCRLKAVKLFKILKGDTKVIRKELLKRDSGICVNCKKRKRWQADHIIPVMKGGGACTIDNFQTLCVVCHKAKTRLDLMK